MMAGEIRVDGQVVQASGFRIPPQATEVEKHVLGAVFIDAVNAGPALETLKTEDFYLEKHQVLWEAVIALATSRESLSLLTIADHLRKAGKFELAGGDGYLIEISSEVVSAANVDQHAAIIREKAMLRRLIAGCSELLELGYSTKADLKPIMGRAEALLLALAEERLPQGFVAWDKITPTTLKNLERATSGKLTGVATGLADLDRVTNGLQPTDFIILAGRPAMGKTALGLSIGWRTAKQYGTVVAFFSMEMGKEQLQLRVFCSYRNINIHNLRGRQTQQELDAFAEGVRDLQGIPLFIDDANGKTPMQILSQCRRLKLEKGLGLIIVDFCQLGKLDEQVENRALEVGKFAYALKGIAKELHIPVIGLAQLNRECEKRNGDEEGHIAYKQSDLNESGGLEQAADIIGVIHRCEVLSKKAEVGKAELQIVKYRNGPTGDIFLRFNKESASFSDYIPPAWVPESAPPPREEPPQRYRGHYHAGTPRGDDWQ
jgi:replicative DNA helicase